MNEQKKEQYEVPAIEELSVTDVNIVHGDSLGGFEEEDDI